VPPRSASRRRTADWLIYRRPGLRFPLLGWPLALLLVVLVHAVAGGFVLRLWVNNSPEVYYPDDSPAVQVRNMLRAEFPSDEVLTVVFRGPDLYTRDFLQRLSRMESELQDHPLVDRVTSIVSMERVSGSADGFSVERLVDARRVTDATVDAIRARVLSDRFAPGLLASKDGQVLAVAVRPRQLEQTADRLAISIATAAAINAAGLQRWYAGEAGPIAVDVAQLESVLDDTKLFMPLTAGLGLALLYWVVGRLRPVIVGGVAMSAVILPTLALLSALNQPYTMASAILPSLLAAYTFATLLHFYAAVQKAQGAGGPRSLAVDKALAETFKPSLFNVLTTSAGLLSLVLVPMPPIRMFGIAGAFGTLLVFLTVFVLVPPFLAQWDNRRWPQRDAALGRFGRFAGRLARFSMRRAGWVLLLAVLLLAAVFPLARQVKIESDPLSFFSDTHPVNRHTALVESSLSGVTTLEISLRGGGRDSLQSVAMLQRIDRFQQWLETLPEVDRTASMVDVVEEMHWAMNGEKPAFRALPRNDRLLRQYLLVYDGEDLYEFVNREFEHTRIVLNLNVHGATKIQSVIDRIRGRLAAEPLEGLRVEVGGFGRLFADQADLLVTGQVNSFLGAFGQIFLLMAILWRSLGASALCLVPNLAPLYFIFVLMGSTGITLDLATVMIAGVVLGITVDDTIHLYHGYRHRREAGISPALAIARSFQSAGRAVLAISLLLTTQFLLLATSAFVPTSNFGLMTAVGLFAGQFSELLLMPALLVLHERWKSRRGRHRPARPRPRR
jgi:predicted RND superfamily exporter protein